MDLKMTGPGADAVNRESFSAQQAKLDSYARYGAAHVAARGNGNQIEETAISKAASQSYKQAATGERGSHKQVITPEFNKAAARKIDGRGR